MARSRFDRIVAIAAVCGLASLALIGAALAQTAVAPAPEPVTTINIGTTLSNILQVYATALGSLVAALASWVMFKITKIRMDAESRTAIETFATNAAGEFLGKFDSLKNITVDVHNPIIAQLANAALTRIPDGLAHFGWGAEQVKQRIVEKIGVLTAPSVATVVVTPPAPSIPRPL